MARVLKCLINLSRVLTNSNRRSKLIIIYMEGLEEIEEIFINRIKPYEERIKALEDSERAKESEIEKLKQSIVQLNKIIDQLKLNNRPGGKK